ncbi:MAG: S8 family serine peptidase, partial [Bdellovibrionales bacterium]|nr:S8 family serine peptidase [Bdellovibrionales bacterium]
MCEISAVSAAPLEVYRDEYVVERAVEPGAAHSNTVAGYPVRRRSGQAELILINSTISGAAQERRIERYTPQKDRCAELMSQDLSLRSCTPNFVIRAALTPSDPFFPLQHGLHSSDGNDIGATKAWEITQGDDDVIVATLDTGVDYSHPDLHENIWVNPNEIPNNGKDDDNNGYVDDLHGINADTRSGDPFDDHFHGTHVAGIIAARGDNQIGISGVSWRTKILAVKFLDREGAGSVMGEITGLNYIVDLKKRGANIVALNASYGGAGYTQATLEAYKKVSEAGIVVIAAAGNESANNDRRGHYPSNYDLDNIIAVAAISSDGALADFSNYGIAKVDVAAPGVEIASTIPGGGYGYMDGTSMAAPFVSGAVALLASHNRELQPKELIQRIFNGANRYAGLQEAVASGRLLNLSNALNNRNGDVKAYTPRIPELGSNISSATFNLSVIGARQRKKTVRSKEPVYLRIEDSR